MRIIRFRDVFILVDTFYNLWMLTPTGMPSSPLIISIIAKRIPTEDYDDLIHGEERFIETILERYIL